jgi:L-amino acid N-acyltransferase YncA
MNCGSEGDNSGQVSTSPPSQPSSLTSSLSPRPIKDDCVLCHICESHWDEVAAIYAEGIRTGQATFQQTVPSWDDWNANHLAHSRLLLLHNDVIVGWAALSPVSKRAVYAGVAEVSIYVAEASRGRGVGSILMDALIEENENNGIWTLQSGIFPANVGSLKLHNQKGFRVVGHRERIGVLDGVWKDVVLLERRSQRL